jgi:hypothetical protein
LSQLTRLLWNWPGPLSQEAARWLFLLDSTLTLLTLYLCPQTNLSKLSARTLTGVNNLLTNSHFSVNMGQALETRMAGSDQGCNKDIFQPFEIA